MIPGSNPPLTLPLSLQPAFYVFTTNWHCNFFAIGR